MPDNAGQSLDEGFSINLIKGRIAQVIIENILRKFGYEVYPFGYESYLTNIIKFINSYDDVAARIRTSPDALVYDRDSDGMFLLEIKAHYSEVNNFFLRNSQYQKYIENWPCALLTVFVVPQGAIWCVPFSELIDSPYVTDSQIPNPNGGVHAGKSINLPFTCRALTEVFHKIPQTDFDEYLDKIKEIALRPYIQQDDLLID